MFNVMKLIEAFINMAAGFLYPIMALLISFQRNT
jgi:hypothetical protein